MSNSTLYLLTEEHIPGILQVVLALEPREIPDVWIGVAAVEEILVDKLAVAAGRQNEGGVPASAPGVWIQAGLAHLGCYSLIAS